MKGVFFLKILGYAIEVRVFLFEDPGVAVLAVFSEMAKTCLSLKIWGKFV